MSLESLRGRVLDICSFERLAFSRYPEVFGEVGRRLLEANQGPFEKWLRAMRPDQPDTAEITEQAVWERKEPAAPSSNDLSRRTEVLDVMGVRRQLVFPAVLFLALPIANENTALPPPPTREGVQAARDFLAVYNTWAGELTQKQQDRLRVAGALATNVSAEELARSAEGAVAAGLKAVAIHSSIPPAGLSPAHPALDAFYAILAQADVALLFRANVMEGGYRALSQWGMTPGANEYTQVTNLTGCYESIATFLTAMVLGGVFERHPTLRLGIARAGASWVGPLAELMDFTARGDSRLPLKPSEYLARNVRVAPSLSPTPSPAMMDTFEPVEAWMERYPLLRDVYAYTTDYPLISGGTWSLRKYHQRLAPLGDEIVEKFFCSNGQLLMP